MICPKCHNEMVVVERSLTQEEVVAMGGPPDCTGIELSNRCENCNEPKPLP
jgi:ssDNA-binding Zn-finger/Zn-ribbon topoisomerase 1